MAPPSLAPDLSASLPRAADLTAYDEHAFDSNNASEVEQQAPRAAPRDVDAQIQLSVTRNGNIGALTVCAASFAHPHGNQFAVRGDAACCVRTFARVSIES